MDMTKYRRKYLPFIFRAFQRELSHIDNQSLISDIYHDVSDKILKGINERDRIK